MSFPSGVSVIVPEIPGKYKIYPAISPQMCRNPQPLKLPHNLFSHPDFTVGPGISPDRPLAWFADFTAGRESHPAPKNLFCILLPIIMRFGRKIKWFSVKAAAPLAQQPASHKNNPPGSLHTGNREPNRAPHSGNHW